MDSKQLSKTAREYFLQWQRDNPSFSLGIGAILTMDHMLQNTDFTSIGQLITSTLPTLTHALVHTFPGSMSVENACKIFSSVVTRGDTEGLHDIGPTIRQNSSNISKSVAQSNKVIHKSVNSFLRDGQIILLHSFSHVVTSALINAASQGKRFRVIITESRPECEGYKLASKLKAHGIPVTMIVDSMVGHILATVDLVLVGAEAVVENGGIINKVGTYQIGIIAKAMNKPMYVLSESFKFCRQFIFHQQDIEDNVTSLINSRIENAKKIDLENNENFFEKKNNENLKKNEIELNLSQDITISSLSHLPEDNNNSYIDKLGNISEKVKLSTDSKKNLNFDQNFDPNSSTLSNSQFTDPSLIAPHTLRQHIVPLVIPTALCHEDVEDDEYLDHKWDFTPPEYVTLIFSDVGILSPSAVSDELFKLSY